ncbi:MAG: flagellar biosynthetic protein FliO [Lachnospiraceae bacterium]|nr:flagellar biosynthetic protein FliO [Lachnospiraceae bacterium]
MMVLLTGNTDSYAQFITVLIIFVLVLAVTALVTRWIANYQKEQSVNVNIEVIETTRISGNKYIQIVRLGEKYVAIAVCKDTVTLLGEISKEQLREENHAGVFRFRDILERAAQKTEVKSVKAEDNQSDDEV